MFAFCPKTTAKMCGVSSDTTEDDSSSLVLDAYTTPKTITLKGDTALQYKEGGQSTGKFQSCYYKINAPHSSESAYHHDGSKRFLTSHKVSDNLYPNSDVVLKLKASTEMNVYAYGGPNRRSATTAITAGNEPLKLL
jgi:hypothetical protein